MMPRPSPTMTSEDTSYLRMVFDSNREWAIFSFGIGVVAVVVHLTAELLNLYDNTNIDLYTHFLSVMAFVCLFLNFNFKRNKMSEWGLPIALAGALAILWELFEELVEYLGIFLWIQNFLGNAIQDLFIGMLGAIIAIVVYEKFKYRKIFEGDSFVIHRNKHKTRDMTDQDVLKLAESAIIRTEQDS